jgi:hypothetical protein
MVVISQCHVCFFPCRGFDVAYPRTLALLPQLVARHYDVNTTLVQRDIKLGVHATINELRIDGRRAGPRVPRVRIGLQ